jgi:hypothetical protein
MLPFPFCRKVVLAVDHGAVGDVVRPREAGSFFWAEDRIVVTQNRIFIHGGAEIMSIRFWAVTWMLYLSANLFVWPS